MYSKNSLAVKKGVAPMQNGPSEKKNEIWSGSPEMAVMVAQWQTII